ncbi:polcalcin Phl p 7-like [Canna indica]|uniref:Polcalcin Phl p 7-like n=1 Tax=Canna indica TaxID=4628 RepID=A0AAQ3JQK4_9LILI|nr:polcalcin Phl p 7-like [Canna indica]
MAIKGSSHPKTTVRSSGEEITVEEFRKWLKSFDTNKDGRISQDELRRAIRSIHVRFSGWKSKRGIRYADADADGFIEDDEIENLLDFAQKSLGLKIVTY